ncbi:phospholipase A1 VesT1.02-like [Lucilia sericata]|uniref:phospholipase A1 VesT1.02-like n=1 Tax=Lucilia sericata TaxID=13632 RepID=UPI0018A8435B|nr:phospholipase A1 VesT1.02-like [Lucilia sericata]
MKYLLLILLCAVDVTINAVPNDKRAHGQNGWYIPVTEESFEWVDKDNVDTYLENVRKKYMEMNNSDSLDRRNIFFPQNDVFFHLYTNKNQVHSQLITIDKRSIDSSYFNPAHPTRISIHGFNSGPDGFINYGVRDAWLSKGDYNYIFVEWNAARYSNYAMVVTCLKHVAFDVGNLIDFLAQNNYIKLEELVMVGHSLGAHIVGFSARSFHNIKTIIGLDPASPLIKDNCEDRLCHKDAKYVESIHTNGGNFGYLTPIGRGSFYPNGGQSQPACPWYQKFIGICDHSMAIKYYAEAIQLNDFPSIKCKSYEDAIHKRCGKQLTAVRMGGMGDTDSISGVYYVPVSAKIPYGVPPGTVVNVQIHETELK